jgi:competence protein ComEC
MMRAKNNYHISIAISAFCTGSIGGILMGGLYPKLTNAPAPIFLFVPALLIILLINRSLLRILVAIIIGFTIGYTYSSIHQNNLSRINCCIGQNSVVRGIVKNDPYTAQGNVQFSLHQTTIDGVAYDGVIWISSRTKDIDKEVKRGNFVVVEGVLKEGFGTINGAIYRAEITTIATTNPDDIARQIRDSFASNIQQHIKEPEAGLGIGYITGYTRALSADVTQDFRTLGLVHLVVASGFHLTIVVRFMRRFFMPLSKYLATAGSLAMIFGFLLITGFSTAMQRAALVTSLSLLAWYYGRQIPPIRLLLLAATITLFINPSYILGDIGWYLSFAAFAGVIILAPLINAYFWGDNDPPALRYILLATISAQLATLPIIIFYFQQMSPLSIIANLLIVPFVPLTMLLTFLVGVLHFIAPPLATIISWPTRFLLEYMTTTVAWLSTSNYARIEINISVALIIAYYTLLIGFTLVLKKKTNVRNYNPIV